MTPETAREAWERGYDDAQNYHEFGSRENWKAITGSDPTEKGYAERVFGPLARDWQAGWDHGISLCADSGVPCCCQGVSHMEGESGHTYLGVRTGGLKARDESRESAFPVCDDCAYTCMAGRLVKERGKNG